ncbi:Imidazole glycerol phosphate synthase subunit HisF, partial [Clarias magur]
MKEKKGVWRVEQKQHSALMPVPLFRRLIRSFSSSGRFELSFFDFFAVSETRDIRLHGAAVANQLWTSEATGESGQLYPYPLPNL